MTLFQRSERRSHIDDPSRIPTNGELARNSAGIVVTPDIALRLGAVWSCVSLIADSLATTPIAAYRRGPDRRIPIEPTPTLVQQPYSRIAPVDWFTSMLVSLLLRGNAFGLLMDFDRLEFPRQIAPLNPDLVRLDHDRSTGEVRYWVDGRRVPSEQIFHVRAFSLAGSEVGLSPISYHAQTIGIGIASQRFGANYFEKDGIPQGTLESDHEIDEEQAKTMKRRFKEAASNRDIVAMGAGLKFNQVQVDPEESQFLETQRLTATQIAAIFRCPPEMVGGSVEGSSLTYSNIEQRTIDFQQFTLMPWAVRLEQALSALLPRGQFVRFNFAAALRVDTKTRYQAHQLALTNGWRNPNEVRAIEDEAPIGEQGDIYVWPPTTPATPTATEEEESE